MNKKQFLLYLFRLSKKDFNILKEMVWEDIHEADPGELGFESAYEKESTVDYHMDNKRASLVELVDILHVGQFDEAIEDYNARLVV